MAIMRDQHHRTGKVGQGVGQRLTHIQIQMVRRLIQQQQVRFVPGDQGQRQPRALAAGKAIHHFKCAIATEVPGTEKIAHDLRGRAWSFFLQMLQRGGAIAQAFHGVLRKIANLQVLVRLALTTERFQFAHQRLYQRRLAGAVGTEQANAFASLDAETHVAEHHVARAGRGRSVIRRIPCSDVLQLQHGVRQPSRRAELETEGAFGAHGFRTCQFLQALHARLRLLGLGRLGLEAVDERLQVRAFGLFALVRQLLLTQLFGAQALERAVIADVQFRAASIQMQRVRNHAIEKLAIMRNDQQCALIAAQPFFQPQHRVQVEVVGRLIQQQQIRRTHQCLRQVQSSAPATGKCAHGPFVGVRRKAQTVQQLAGAGTAVITVQFLDALMRAGQRVHVAVLGRVRLGAQGRGQLGIAGQHIVDGRIRQWRRLLRDGGKPQLHWQVQLTSIAIQLALQRGEQARLATTVAPDHPEPPATLDDQINIGKQQAAATAQGKMAKRNHGLVGVRTMGAGSPQPPMIAGTACLLAESICAATWANALDLALGAARRGAELAILLQRRGKLAFSGEREPMVKFTNMLPAVAVLAAVLGFASMQPAWAAQATHGDNLLIHRVQQEKGMNLPARGMTMAQVERNYGAPMRKLSPRGGDTKKHPQINRWDYSKFIVYFEHSHVIHSVLNTPAGNNTNPAAVD